MRKKILALLLAGLMVMSMAACGGNDSGNANDGSTGSDTPAADNSSSAADDSTSDPSTGSYTIGICQLMEHEAECTGRCCYLRNHYQRLCIRRR